MVSQKVFQLKGWKMSSRFKHLAINYLLEENKFTGVVAKNAQRELLLSVTDSKLFDMLLAKARYQGQEQAMKFYEDCHNFTWKMKEE